jgi:hypothetical protein
MFLANPSSFLPGFRAIFWHATCTTPAMANRMNALKKPQKAALGNRSPKLLPGPFLAQLQEQSLKDAQRRPRQQLTVEVQGQPLVPRPVKIIHADSIQDTTSDL